MSETLPQPVNPAEMDSAQKFLGTPEDLAKSAELQATQAQESVGHTAVSATLNYDPAKVFMGDEAMPARTNKQEELTPAQIAEMKKMRSGIALTPDEINQINRTRTTNGGHLL